MSGKVAVVTGANKGIGYAVVRGLCSLFNGTVYLTARNVERGQAAVAKLEQEGLKANFHQLDITDPPSVEAFRDHIVKIHGGIDVLINNAAIAFTPDAPETLAEQAELTLFVNYFSLASTCNILFPILRDNARVVNISSSLGLLSKIPDDSLKDLLKDPELTVATLSGLMRDYVAATKEGTHLEKWFGTPYEISKLGVTALSRIQQRMLEHRGIAVNSVCPGYVATDMTCHKGVLTPEQGAESPLHLALEAAPNIRGQFMNHDCQLINWADAD